MNIFHSYVSLPEGNFVGELWIVHNVPIQSPFPSSLEVVLKPSLAQGPFLNPEVETMARWNSTLYSIGDLQNS